jgi:alpha-tubulin suppressor-like RCC1 family protein
MDRRTFLNFAGLGAIAGGIVEAFRLRSAWAGTWSRTARGQGTAGTWQKLNRPKGAYSALGVGGRQTSALTADGLVFACGYNIRGQLGDGGALTSRLTFVQAVGISNAIAVAASDNHTLAIRSDGLLYGTGYNGYGAMGDNTIGTRSSYAAAISISNLIAVAAGYFHTSVLRSDGLVFGCGYGGWGQLGNNANSSCRTFVQAVGISNAVAIAAGDHCTMAIRSDGLVFGAGFNAYGNLGDGSITQRSTFVQAIGVSNAVAVAITNSDGNNAHTAVLRVDGVIFACGRDNEGQTGSNSVTGSQSVFLQGIGISNAVAIACGGKHTVALRSDGTVFACGYNFYGQLGDNTAVNKSTFVQAIGISNAIAIGAGQFATVALRSDGLIFSCGQNAKGQNGDNTTTSRSTFVQAIWP